MNEKIDKFSFTDSWTLHIAPTNTDASTSRVDAHRHFHDHREPLSPVDAHRQIFLDLIAS